MTGNRTDAPRPKRPRWRCARPARCLRRGDRIPRCERDFELHTRGAEQPRRLETAECGRIVAVRSVDQLRRGRVRLRSPCRRPAPAIAAAHARRRRAARCGPCASAAPDRGRRPAAPAQIQHADQLRARGCVSAVGVFEFGAVRTRHRRVSAWVAVRNTATRLNSLPWRSG